jgi:uncharacterized protein YjbJ (UPF0337 family)
MNHDILSGQWKQLSGKIRAKWGKLTDDDMHLIGGKKDILIGKLQERYGHAKDRLEKEVDDVYADMDESDAQRREQDDRVDAAKRPPTDPTR